MGHTVFELKVTLRDIEPPIWRVIEVPGEWPLDEVHLAIQAAMGWNNSHLHQFIVGKVRYGMMEADGEFDRGLEDERDARLERIVQSGQSFVYEYDFGDGWQHDVEVTRVASAAKEARPRCLAGARACPPEDCGGPHGYARLLEILADPKHPEHVSLKEWANDLEPERFSVPKNGDLRKAIETVRPDVDAHAGDGEESFGNLPRAIVQAALQLDPMQRASLAALLAGSLAEEVGQLQSIIQKIAPVVRAHGSSRHRASKRTRR
jgi:hypothetical protein